MNENHIETHGSRPVFIYALEEMAYVVVDE